MRRWTKASLLLLLAATVVGCVNETEMRKRDARDFLQKSTGEYTNEAGELHVVLCLRQSRLSLCAPAPNAGRARGSVRAGARS